MWNVVIKKEYVTNMCAVLEVSESLIKLRQAGRLVKKILEEFVNKKYDR